MADLNEQMTSLLETEELPYADDASSSITRTRGIPKSKPFNPVESQALLESYKPKIKEARQEAKFQENKETAKSIGTGLLTGFAGLPSDVIEGVNFVNDYLAEKGSPKALLFKDALNKVREDYGRDAFDKKFTEITGIKSDASNVDQIVGEILSPAGAIVATVKGGVKATQGAIKLYDFLQDAFKTQTNLLRGDVPPGGATQLVTGNVDNTATQMGNINQIKNKEIAAAAVDAAKTTKTVNSGEPNQPIINLSEIGIKTQAGQDAKDAYLKLEDNIFKMRGQKYSELNYKNLPSSVKDDLYKQTGVYRGKDEKFRFKISTGEAQFNQGGLKQLGIIEGGGNIVPRFNASKIPSEGITLEEMLNFQPLYKQYLTKESNFFDGVKGVENPAQFDLLKNIKIKSMDEMLKLLKSEGATPAQINKFRDTTSAVYSVRGSRETIYVSSNDLSKVRSDLLHEVQHAIQRREGFAPGGNTQAILNKNTNGSFRLDQQKLEDDQKQILDDFIKDTPQLNMNDNSIKIFKSATDKLVQREFKYMYKDSLNLKNTKDFLPNNAGTYRVNINDDFNNVSYTGDNLNFTQREADLINKLTDNSNFREYMKFRALTERQAIRLQRLEAEAVIEYRKLGGEVQARRTETMDALVQQKVKELRQQGHLKPNEAVSPALYERLFRAVGLNVKKANPKYLDMLPSKFEGQGVLQGQDIKPIGTNVDTYAKIGEQ